MLTPSTLLRFVVRGLVDRLVFPVKDRTPSTVSHLTITTEGVTSRTEVRYRSIPPVLLRNYMSNVLEFSKNQKKQKQKNVP